MFLMMVTVLQEEDLMIMTIPHLLTPMEPLAWMQDHLETTLSLSVDHMDHLVAYLKKGEDHLQ